MQTWTKTAGIIFLAAASVYSFGATPAVGQSPASPAAGAKADTSNVKVLEETSDPFASPTTKPTAEGQSVSANQVNISDAGNVEIHVNDANLVEVLRMLSLQSQKNIIASKEVHGTITANLYDVTVREALDAILHANGYAYREKGNFIYVYTTKELADQEKADRKANTEVFRLFYTPAVNVVTLIKPAMSTDGQASATTPAVVGMESGSKNTGGDAHATQDAIVVTDYPENLDKIRKLIKEIDRRPQQVLVEATILQATLQEDNAMGVDFNILGGLNFDQITHANGQLLTSQLAGTTSGSSTGSTGTTGGTITNSTGGATPFGSVPNATGTGNNFTQGINGFRVGVVSNSVSVFVAALETVTDTTVLANPKVLALNKQSGEVIVGREDGYLTSTVTQTSTVQTVELFQTGTKLMFRPFIGDDGYIRMEIHPEDSTGGVTNGLPHKTTTEVTSNVMVKDGHTIVIGGLFREESTVGKSQIPFLGDLPLAGYLFRNQTDHTQRQEIIVLLTPHIIKDDKAYSESSEKELAEGMKLRVGVRQGMMVLGRERLAECEYMKAVEEMKKPEPDRKSALWHLDCATNLNPTFREAIELKQEISGHEITAVDNSSIRDFVRRQIIADQASGATSPTLPHSTPLNDEDSRRNNGTMKPMSTTEPADKPEIKSAKNEVPATQDVAETPATQNVAEAPATQNVAETPATQNVAETPAPQNVAETPATQNVAQAPAAQNAAEAPATQNVAQTPSAPNASETPAKQNVAETPAGQNVAETPATQNVAEAPAKQNVAETPATPNVADNSANEPAAKTTAAAASTTEPSGTAQADSTAKDTPAQPAIKQNYQEQKSTVTELPTEEINTPSSSAADSSSNTDASEEKAPASDGK